MKVTRSYWLGLGSGFILSAMLAMVIPPLQGQALNQTTSQTPHTSSTSQTAQSTQPQTNQTLQNSQTRQSPPSVRSNKPQDGLPSADAIAIDRDFVIAEGASLEQIADQLVAQGLLKNKADFLAAAHKMGVEVKFRVGTFRLSLGLTPEEIIRRLLKI
ncbi:MAG: ABC transporter substrate-binding protein [Bacillota bacterium]|nr:ABC transporter substrate-binding protein [Bacillota bacterium]